MIAQVFDRTATRNGCGGHCLHPKAVENALANLPGREELLTMGGFFRMLGDPTRLTILHALTGGELCVCDLSEVIGLSVSAVSHQLAAMRNARLVKHRREGKTVYYTLNDAHVRQVLRYIRAHAVE